MRSMSARHREGLQVGYPNPLVQPVDTLGFATPGPALWRESERGAKKTFGLALKPALKDDEGPGIWAVGIAVTLLNLLLCVQDLQPTVCPLQHLLGL